ncbi:hypothetical protein PUNSTDRAFT_63888 [Punctularia strigosozonata HHB-11173 SS5]|uniref:uncharacterized protein n=1 Tax=Punctularia strigosozonata (strain HHB-11173) TaxID=741275 RepID=UPI0004417B9B|nr:uncharacterized protein PUNSTDRAFT_63888 [Punctularia strigosozonata HHB-11173 SS5]EIN10903.1 hypothetical protein PUNSTDRAFT_63888 [Punctularia strigosozonata HHB-11173 SS5]
MASSSTTATRSAFFYGTLLHPKILKRVINNDGSHLEICPAVLLANLTDVQHADYPGILPYENSRVLFERDLEPEQRCVRGTLVRGLTDSDVRSLDFFEGAVRVSSLRIHMSREDPRSTGLPARGCACAPVRRARGPERRECR